MEIKPLAYKTLELMELAWEKINSPKEFNDDKMVRAIQLLEEVKEYKLDCKFSAIKGLEIIFK
jgi:RNAse (barnase) inhibitor barstar